MSHRYVLRNGLIILENPDPFVLVRGIATAYGTRATYYRLGEILRANLEGWRIRLGDSIILPQCRRGKVLAIGREGTKLVIDLV